VTTVANIAISLQAHAAKRRPWIRRLPALLLLSDEARLPDPLAALARLPKGSGLVFRHYGARNREALARALAAKTRARGIRLLVAGDARLASGVRAEGLHLPEAKADSPLALGPKSSRKKMIVTMAAHSLRAVFRAARLGADAAILGPVFETASHPGTSLLGVLRFARICRRSPIPVYAVGGIGPGTARRLKESGAAGIAGIGGVLPPAQRGLAQQVPLV
jgi:thiamine-phosphate pyrophosphorylase